VADYSIEGVESAAFTQMAYVLHRPDRGDSIVVDPGFDARALLRLLERIGKPPAAILNTHGHVDHIAGNQALKEAFPTAPLIIGRIDAPMLADPDLNLSRPFGSPIVSPPADQLVDEGDRLDLGGFSMLVREIPGHSPGSVVYILDAEEPTLVLGGDVLFAGSIGRTDFGGDPERNFDLLMSGIVAKLLPLPDAARVFPGHGPDTTIGLERRTNPYVRQFLASAKPDGP
jgi:glyoxylase-like metal-dependent hydrolase (beta-lactamase superfamily II)